MIDNYMKKIKTTNSIVIEDRLDQLINYYKTLNEMEVAVNHFSNKNDLKYCLNYVREKWKKSLKK